MAQRSSGRGSAIEPRLDVRLPAIVEGFGFWPTDLHQLFEYGSVGRPQQTEKLGIGSVSPLGGTYRGESLFFSIALFS
jgi:hypothetical protein